MEASLLVEVLTEELPPKSLRSFADSFCKTLTADLRDDGLLAEGSTSKSYATPRRLAVVISRVRDRAPDQSIERTGPSVKVGLSADGKPTQALIGFAKKANARVEDLVQIDTPKGKVFAYREMARGTHLETNLDLKVEDALRRLPVPKIMRWGSGDVQFVRPVHGLVMMHGGQVVRGKVLGLESTNRTRGHRFLGKGEITLAGAHKYEAQLRDEGMVLAEFAARRAEIERQLKTEAGRQNAALGSYEDLLDEVTALVEHPSVYTGTFEPSFLEVPHECLILTMRQNQKYFPLFDQAGKLLPRFLIVSNMKVADPRHIVGGNERVVRPRLEDARFFYNRDRRIPLVERLSKLASVVYYKDRLGTQLDRVQRIKSLASRIARALKVELAKVEHAADLAKADLVTEMVGEFPELQGVMGRYYALADGEPVEIANAIEQHYWPRFSGDRLPEDPISCVLALADKLEAIVGMFGVGNHPTGEKDPYGLRRHAFGIIRILVERKIEMGLEPLVMLAQGEMPTRVQSDSAVVTDFLRDRAKSYFSEHGFARPAIESVLGPFGFQSPLHTLLDVVAEASRFIATEEGRILAEANKRITNILKKSGFPVPFGLRPQDLMKEPNPALFKESTEIEFWNALRTIGAKSVQLKNEKRFAESLRMLSELGNPTKQFFETVRVNVDDPSIQSNRITLLQHARAYMNQAADLSLMAT
jgi:glycyl-tRNA synthetase beta chain